MRDRTCANCLCSVRKTLRADVLTGSFLMVPAGLAVVPAPFLLRSRSTSPRGTHEQGWQLRYWYPSTGVVRLPSRRIDVQVLRLLLDAIRRTIRIGIQYQSMSRTEPKRRVISPHAIVFDGIRWHVRGYCHERNEFRDFVFARITDVASDSSGLLGVSGDGDQAWNSFVEVILAVAPHLSEGQKRAVEVDYGMDRGLLTLRVREALLLYFYQQLPLFEPVGRARYNQIILQNRESLLPHFEKLGIDL